MNLILLEKSDFIAGNAVRLTGRRAQHIRTVLKALPGSVCKVGLLDGPTGLGKVLETAPDSVTMEVALTAPPPPECGVTLVAALPRPQTYRKMLHIAISMGVKKLVMIQTFKVDKSYWGSSFLAEDFFRREALLALEQSLDTVMPEIAFHRRFKPFLEDVYPALAAGKTAFVAHPDTTDFPPPEPVRPALLIVGPEGGFTDYEVASFLEAGARPVTLGRRIFRTEVALPALLAPWQK